MRYSKEYRIFGWFFTFAFTIYQFTPTFYSRLYSIALLPTEKITPHLPLALTMSFIDYYYIYYGKSFNVATLIVHSEFQ